MTRSESLPVEVAWLRSIPRDEIRRRLAKSIAERATTAGVNFSAVELSEEIDALDSRYFDAHDAGREEEAMRFFKRARLLSAWRFILDGKDEEAVYEFFHSLDEAIPTALFAALPKG